MGGSSIFCSHHRKITEPQSLRYQQLLFFPFSFHISKAAPLHSSFVSIFIFTLDRDSGLKAPIHKLNMALLVYSNGPKWDQNAPGERPLIMTSITTHSWRNATPTHSHRALGSRCSVKRGTPHTNVTSVCRLFMARDASTDTNKQLTSPTPTCTGKINASLFVQMEMNDSLVRNARGLFCFSVWQLLLKLYHWCLF